MNEPITQVGGLVILAVVVLCFIAWAIYDEWSFNRREKPFWHRGRYYTDAKPPEFGPGHSVTITSDVPSGDVFPIKPSETMGAASDVNLHRSQSDVSPSE